MIFKDFLNFLFSYFYIAFVALTSILFFCISCLIWLMSLIFDPKKIILNLFASFWASTYLWCMPLWGVSIQGREKMDMRKSYVIVSNHQSQLDILLVYRLFFPMRWISKKEVIYLPIIGWNMLLNGYVLLKRGDKESIRQMMNDCERMLARGLSIMIFPEGTRSKTGILKPFKYGAFILAKNMKKPILPIVINNSKDALPKHSLRFHGYHKMEVKVLDQIEYQEFADMEVEEITEMVKKMISSHVKEHIELETVN